MTSSLPRLEDILAEEDDLTDIRELDMKLEQALSDEPLPLKELEIPEDDDSTDEEILQLVKTEEKKIANLNMFNPRNIVLEPTVEKRPIQEIEDPAKLKNVDMSKLEKDEDVDMENLIKTARVKESALRVTQGAVESSLKISGLEVVEMGLTDVEKEKKFLKKLEEKRTMAKTHTKNKILTIGRLEQIAEKLKDGKMKRATGLPTAIAVSKYITLGTSHGIVLVFDHFQNLVCMLGTLQGVEYGSVTAIDISPDSDYLLVGHEKGTLVLWDFNHKRPLTTLNDVHHQRVMHVRFFSDGRSAVTADIEGHVHQVIFRKSILWGMTGESIPVLNEKLGGQVTDLQVLNTAPNVTHRIHEYRLFAIATRKGVQINSAGIGIMHVTQIKPPSEDLNSVEIPLISWRKAISDKMVRKNSSENTKDPILAIYWGPKFIQIIRFSVVSNSFVNPRLDIQWNDISIHVPPFSIKAMDWLSPETLLFITENESLCVYDPFLQKDLENHKLENFHVLFHTKYHEEQVGGQQQLGSTIPTSSTCYQNALKVHQGRFYVVGNQNFCGGRILPWEDRLNSFVSQGQYFDAIALALDFYEGRQVAPDLPQDPVHLNRIFGQKMESILQQYVDTNLKQKPSLDENQIQILASTVIDCCVNLDKVPFLLEKLFPLFVRAKREDLFVYKLVPFVLGEKLRSIPQKVFEKIVDVLVKNDLQTVERMIMKLDMTTLDFQYVVLLCRRHLSSALFYLFIHGLDEYITPLDDHVKFLMEHEEYISVDGEELRQKAVSMVGYKILLYLLYCFRGESFPVPRRISSARAKRLTEELIAYLFEAKVTPYPLRYPRATTLLKFDSKEFLNVLSVSFDNNSNSEQEQLKDLVELLLNMMIDRRLDAENPSAKYDWPFTLAQQNDLLLFLSKYLSRGMIKLDDYVARRMLTYLFSPKEESHAERDDALLEFVKAFTPRDNKSTHNPYEKYCTYNFIVPRATAASFHKVCEYFWLRAREFRKIVESRINAPEHKAQVFEFVVQICLNENEVDVLTEKERDVVKSTVLEFFTKLVEIDNVQAADLICTCFPESHPELVSSLDSSPEVLFKYLQGRDQISPEEEGDIDEWKEPKEGWEEKEYLKPVQNSSALRSSELVLYFDLLCRYSPSTALNFVKTHKNISAKCLDIAKKYEILDAVAELYLIQGNFLDGVNLYLKMIDPKVNKLEADICGPGPLPPEEPFPYTQSEKDLLVVINACMTNLVELSKVDINQTQKMWFDLLTGTMQPLKNLQHVEEPSLKRAHNTARSGILSHDSSTQSKYLRLRSSLTRFAHEIILNMIKSGVRYTTIDKVVRNHAKFKEFKDIFKSLLKDNSYDRTMFTDANRLLEEDAYEKYETLIKIKRSAVPEPKVFLAKGTELTKNVSRLAHRQVGNRPPPPISQAPVQPAVAPVQTVHQGTPTKEDLKKQEEARKLEEEKKWDAMINDRIHNRKIVSEIPLKMTLLDLTNTLKELQTEKKTPEYSKKVEKLFKQLIPDLSVKVDHVDLTSLRSNQPKGSSGRQTVAPKGGLSNEDCLLFKTLLKGGD